jgi:preprotein translocase subunit SecA
MQEPEARRALEKAELYYYQKQKQVAQELFELKEELFFTMDDKSHDADLTEMGRRQLDPDDPDGFVLPDLASIFSDIDGDESLSDEDKTKRKHEIEQSMDQQGIRLHSIGQLLKAYCLYEKDVDYVVEENKVVIVDENTGRKMVGRRWSDGLHQAVEAKEGVKIDQETQTLATITIQNYFRLYEKMGGMTGTAETEAAEFHDIYKVDVLVMPTNRAIARIDGNDKVYRSRREKLSSVIQLVKKVNAEGQPILLGTASVDSSETISRMLKREKIVHNVLNAKHHRQEAEIVQRAGLKHAVTVATNMAGRGTDIKLGEGVSELGGLMVIGTERHPSRRIDRQLRGRCARQGDPGESVFYVSFEDDLMRQYGAADRMTRLMDRLKLEEGQELEGGMLTRVIEMAQRRVEERNYMRRKWVLQYDDVMNQQRGVIYGFRNEVLQSEDPHVQIVEIIEEAIPVRIAEYLSVEGSDIATDYVGLLGWVNTTFPLRLSAEEADFESKTEEEIGEFIVDRVRKAYELKMSFEAAEASDEMERYIILKAIDDLWREHLYAMDGLREGIQWRAQGQKDPLVEYKKEAYDMFVTLMDDVRQGVIKSLFTYRTQQAPQSIDSLLSRLKQNQPDSVGDFFGGGQQKAGGDGAAAAAGPGQPQGPQIRLPVKREEPKVGRNEPCPCKSGKKFKQCCGAKSA